MAEKIILADMHTHLNEKKIKPKDYWNSVIEKNLSVIAITEHAEYKPQTAYKKLKATQPKGIILIPGMEAKTTAGHLLVYGKDENIYKIKKLQKINVKIEEALKVVKENNLLASFAHPYGYKSDSTCLILGEEKTKKLIKKFHTGTEYYNGMLGSANGLIFGSVWVKRFYTLFNFLDKNRATRILTLNGSTKIKTQLEQLAIETLNRVRKAMTFSENADFITVGSDAHYPHTIGSSVIQLKRKPKNQEDFLEMIKKRDIIWGGPNVYLNEPIEHLPRKELLEGLKYMTQKQIQKKINPKKLRKVITKKIIKQVKPKINAKTLKGLAKKLPGRKIVIKIKKKVLK